MDDALLRLVATSTALHSMAVSSAHHVTDAGISAAAMAATQLTSLSIEGASASETVGHFLPKVLSLPSLAHLQLDTSLRDLEDLPPAATWCARRAGPCPRRCMRVVVSQVDTAARGRPMQ